MTKHVKLFEEFLNEIAEFSPIDAPISKEGNHEGASKYFMTFTTKSGHKMKATYCIQTESRVLDV